jgi:hypothetical protein
MYPFGHRVSLTSSTGMMRGFLVDLEVIALESGLNFRWSDLEMTVFIIMGDVYQREERPLPM